MEQDLRPTLIFRLRDYAEYGGEKIIKFEGKRYRVVRTYIDSVAIELTVEEDTINRTPVTATTGGASGG